ncbi:DUF4041 domain-containing protein [Acinetobacter sp. ANC 3781]
MVFFLILVSIGLGGMVYYFFIKNKELQIKEGELIEKNKKLSIAITKNEAQSSSDYRQITGLLNQKENLEKRLGELEKYQEIVDIKKYIEIEKENSEAKITKSKNDWELEKEAKLRSYETYKRTIVAESELVKSEIESKIKSVEAFLQDHSEKAKTEVENQAQKLLGEYYDLAQRKLELSKINKALENKIQGYSDEYLLPNQAILEDLIDGYEYLDAAQRLKTIKFEIKTAIKQGVVAECDYVEEVRKATAIAFITNAFNSKADVHVSRLRHDNVGKLTEALKEDYLLLNNYGVAFRNARINPSYLALRIEELKWAALVLEFKEREREEQREIREQIREEEKARKEYERAIKEASKEEDF